MKSHIYVYSGPGAALESLTQTLATLEELVPLPYTIHKIGFRALKGGAWTHDAALLVMPGGADIPYTKYLAGDGISTIRDYIEKGGSYLGICAGAYFACSAIIFEPGTPLEVRGPRELKFFPGLAEGPVLAPYDYTSNSGVRIAELKMPSGDSVFSYFNGGCHFVDAPKIPGVTVHATYGDTEKSALIEMKVGQGTVILSGPHPEFSADRLNEEDPYLKPIIEKLRLHEVHRKEFMKGILGKLGIQV